MRCHAVKSLALLLAAIIGSLLCACSNSEGVDCANQVEEIAAVNEVSSSSDIPKAQEASSSSKELDYLPLDDSEYPYAGIPRIVIETENHQKIKDRETEIPAKLQIWGENAPESEVMELTIRGRGNSTWLYMPQKSYKIEFVNKHEILGMPKDRDWALIANYADKTLMKNYLMYHLSTKLDAYYAPRCEFAELYLNKEYLGVYLLSETIKIGKDRINIPKDSNSYIVEIKENHRQGQQIVYSHILKKDSIGKPFRIHAPKNASSEVQSTLQKHLENFETFLKSIDFQKDNLIANWLDINEYLKYYWIQEFSMNPDAGGYSSIFFSWTKGNTIKMGPVWDFDIAFGNHDSETFATPKGWYIKINYWHSYLLKDPFLEKKRTTFWNEYSDIFMSTLSTIDSIQILLQNAEKNHFKKYKILNRTDFRYHRKKFANYGEAVDDLKKWIIERISWINSQIQP